MCKTAVPSGTGRPPTPQLGVVARQVMVMLIRCAIRSHLRRPQLAINRLQPLYMAYIQKTTCRIALMCCLVAEQW